MPNHALRQAVFLTDEMGNAMSGGAYQTQAASSGPTQLGTTGAVGDYLAGVLVVPTSTTVGAITATDGATAIVLFAGGTISDIKPFPIQFGAKAIGAGWKLTVGVAMSVVAFGSFT